MAHQLVERRRQRFAAGAVFTDTLLGGRVNHREIMAGCSIYDELELLNSVAEYSYLRSFKGYHDSKLASFI